MHVGVDAICMFMLEMLCRYSNVNRLPFSCKLSSCIHTTSLILLKSSIPILEHLAVQPVYLFPTLVLQATSCRELDR